MQHWKQPKAQQTLVLPHPTGASHLPPALHVSVVHGLESEQSVSPQHSRHSAPQSLGVDAPHWQLELEQTAPALHATLQLPQCNGSEVVSTSQPSADCPLQSAQPAMQVGAPPTHVWFGPTGWLQAPQWVGSTSVFAQELPQSCSLLAQVATQVEPLQIGFGLAQVVPHDPQLVGADFVLSHPAVESQFRNPARQSQVPALQVPFSPQALLQEPQWTTLVTRLTSQPSSVSALQSAKPCAQTHAPALQV